MKEALYSVTVKDNYGNYESEFFNTKREEAMKYLNTKKALMKQEYKDWNMESGINYYKWTKGDTIVELFLDITEIE